MISLENMRPESLVNILEHFPTYGLAVKFLWVWLGKKAYTDFKGTQTEEYLRKIFTKHKRDEYDEAWLLSERFHRLDGPAVIEYDWLMELSKAKIYIEKWYVYGKRIVSKKKPHEIIYYDNGNVEKKKFNLGSGKTKTLYYLKNGELDYEEHYRNGKQFRCISYMNGKISYKSYIYRSRKHPIYIGCYTNGNVRIKQYAKHPEGVIMKHYYSSGRIRSICYALDEDNYYQNCFNKKGGYVCRKYYNGVYNDDEELHRNDGPAVIYYRKGKPVKYRYYYYGWFILEIGKKWNTVTSSLCDEGMNLIFQYYRIHHGKQKEIEI